MAHDLHATVHLIERSKQLINAPVEDGIKLVPSGGLTDIQYALEETQSEMYQLEVVCENAVLYPEIDARKPVLRRSQILDAMLEMNGKRPLFFLLTPDEQLKVGNELMFLIKTRVGNLKDAVDFAEGKRLLQEVGLLEESNMLVQDRTVRMAFRNLIVSNKP